MSTAKVENVSDEEYEDALDQTTDNLNKSKSKDADDKNINFEEENEQFETAQELHDEDKEKEEPTPEILDDIIDDDALRELESTMTPEELLSNKEKADKLKLDGNELFKNDEAEQAIELYTEGIKICPTTYTKERAVLYGNRAAAKIKLDSKKSAIDDCTKAIELWPEYVRVLLRRAKLYEHEDKLDEALQDYKQVYELDPGQREAHEACVRLPPIINERNEKMKEEMISKLKDLGNKILKPFGLSTSNFQMQQDPNTGSYSINFNQNAS